MSKYIYTTGRHKSSIARLKLYSGSAGEFIVNEKPGQEYFPTSLMQESLKQPLKYSAEPDKFKMVFKVVGGGKIGQVKACRLALAKALISLDENLRPALKKEGLLTRDSRVKERKKPGLKRARRAPL